MAKSGDAGLTPRQFVMATQRLRDVVQTFISPHDYTVNVKIKKRVFRGVTTITAYVTSDLLTATGPDDVSAYLVVSADFPRPRLIRVHSWLRPENDPGVMRFLHKWSRQFRFNRYELVNRRGEDQENTLRGLF